jgi:hypothetical protein
MSFKLKTIKTVLKKPLAWFYIGGVLLLLIGAAFWCYKVSTDPEQVFWRTVEQSLATRGVTINSEQTSNGTAVHQAVQYSLGATNITHTTTVLSQPGTEVHNEVIGTPTADYTRYVSIKTDQKKTSGGELDFSKILGVWSKGDASMARVFEQSALGTSLPLGGMGIPVAYVTPEVRAELVSQMHHDSLYDIAFDKTKKERKDGRLLYTYEVTIQPVAYAGFMKQFGKEMGLHSLDQLDPNAYKGQPPLKMNITIDVAARHVVSASVPESEYAQTYSAYDVPVMLKLPKDTITSQELQQRLQQLQQ